MGGVLLTGCARSPELSLPPETEPEVIFRLPADYDSTAEYPLVIALHDAGADEEQAVRLWDAGYYFEPNFILLAIRAPFRYKTGYSWVSEERPSAQRAAARTGDERILDVLADFSEKYGIDEVETYLLGVGAAAPQAFYTVLHHPEVFAGVAAISGGPDTLLTPFKMLRKPARYLEFYLAAGREQPAGTVGLVRRTADVLAAAGAEIDLYLYDGSGPAPFPVYRRLQNSFSLSDGEVPEQEFSARPSSRLQSGEEDDFVPEDDE